MEQNFIRTTHIVSAFANAIDFHKVEMYANDMSMQDNMQGCIDFPPIMGFYTTFDPNEDQTIFNLFNEDVQHEVLEGETIFKVTNGHHRSIAAVYAGIWGLETEFDPACKVS